MTTKDDAAAGDLLAAALDYASAGLPVLPLDGKIPRNAGGLTKASTDVAVIANWWGRWPTANVGIRTGAESGLFVLDVDVHHGGGRTLAELERRHGKLGRPHVLSGGGGHHYLFAHPGRQVGNSAGALGSGIDTRGDGGYIVAPPSIHESGRAYKKLRPFDELEPPPEWLLDTRRNGGKPAKVDEVIPEGKRRAAMLTVAGKLKRAGLSGEEILPTLRELNRRCRPPLEEEELRTVAFHSTIEPDPERAIGSVPEVEPQPISEVLAVFRRWLHLPDPGSVYVTFAVVAANRVPSFDPTWMILVGAGGSGKTEALSATSGLDRVHVVATLTEAALLSGTPRKDTAVGASGGLLREIGDSGLIVLKDFGSILSMHNDARAGVLAALREIFDGSWTRLLGTDGGRRLHWEGRVGLLAGATTVLDQHHAVMSQLGERFLLHRVAVIDAPEQGRSSLAHHGRERGMRRELADAAAGLFAGLYLDSPPPLSESDTDRLVSLAVLVSRARSPVVRDSYRREIELVPDSEAPGRIVGALARLLTGLRMIGVDELETWRLTVKTGLDSMPAARRRTLEYLLVHEGPSTTDIATTLGLPNPTAHRVLDDLAAHGVIRRDSQGAGKADLWHIEQWTRDRYDEATSSEKSEVSSFSNPHHTNDDFSEEVGT